MTHPNILDLPVKESPHQGYQEEKQIREKMESLKGGNILKLDKNKC